METKDKKNSTHDFAFYTLAGMMGIGLISVVVYLVYAIFFM